MFSIIGFLLISFVQGCDLQTSLLLQSNSLLPEASDIVKVGLYYYVVGDDTCAITKVAQDGSATAINTQQCSSSDFEAVFRLPGDSDDENPTLVICKEDAQNCSPWRNGQFLDSWILIDGGDDCHNIVNWNKNKGIEGAVGIMNTDGEIFMMALIEGTGSIITYRLDSNRSLWTSQSCTTVPADFTDYSGMDLYNSTLAVVSQKSKKLWVGEVSQTFDLKLTEGTVYSFDSSFRGVEGIFIENIEVKTGSISGVICSDDQGSGNYQNAVHRFSLTCSTTTTTSVSTTGAGGGQYYQSSIGQCDNISELIQDKLACEKAATDLGLADVSMEVTTREDRTYGCYYKETGLDNKLWLNTNDESERDSDDPTRQSLCFREKTPSVSPTQSPSTSTTTRFPSSRAPTRSPNKASTTRPSQSPSTSTTTRFRSRTPTQAPNKASTTRNPTISTLAEQSTTVDTTMDISSTIHLTKEVQEEESHAMSLQSIAPLSLLILLLFIL